MKLRLPPGLRDRIAEEAKRSKKSMNQVIVECLLREFPEVRPLDDLLHTLTGLVQMAQDSENTATRMWAQNAAQDMIAELKEWIATDGRADQDYVDKTDR